MSDDAIDQIVRDGRGVGARVVVEPPGRAAQAGGGPVVFGRGG
jgi:hypothetical protein